MIFSKLMGQFVDVIQWTDNSPDTMVWRFERQGNEIKYGAKLTVREGQMAVFVNEGEIADTFTPGMYELFTRNLPILSTLQAWPHAFESPFKAEVYFCSTRVFTDLKWGTKNPVIARDAEFGPVRLRAFGTYAIRIKDPSVFLREVVGTDGHFTVDEISDQLRNIIVARFGTIVAGSGIPVLDLAANYDQLGTFVQGRIAPEFANYGLELATILVENVSLPPEVEQAMDRRTSMGVVGDLSKYAQFQAAEAMRAAAGNPGAAGQAVGMMVGMGVGQQASPWGARPAEPPPAPPPVPAWPAYHLAVDGKPTGPFGLEQLRAQAASGAMSRASLVWAEGMTGWQAAGEVAALAPLFTAVPRPFRVLPEFMPAGPWGGLRTEQDERAQGGVKVSSPQLRQFPCEQCGAILSYAPGTAELACSYCGHRNHIVETPVEIVEQALAPALRQAAGEAPRDAPVPAKCAACGVDVSFAPPRFAGPCPFCGQPVVADPGPYRQIRPAGVLPFLIGDQEAKRLVADWLKGLWFAPSGTSEQARGPGRLHGVYLPYWTFDSRTSTRYVGRRGDVYYETQYVNSVVNGRRVRQAVRVPKVRWRPASGEVGRDFDDVLVLAGGTLPPHLVEELEPWDLDGMRPFTADYLSGFDGELYQIPVDQGFERAQAEMRAVIAQDIRHDIGGDQQVIERMEVDHDGTTFKHVVLPVWVAAFQFVGKPYRFVVNGRTGEVHGERPWSFWKIAGAVVLAIVVLGIVALVMSQLPAAQDALRGSRPY